MPKNWADCNAPLRSTQRKFEEELVHRVIHRKWGSRFSMPQYFGTAHVSQSRVHARPCHKHISLLDGFSNEAYRIFVGGVNAPREYGSSGDRALRMVCRTSLYWEA